MYSFEIEPTVGCPNDLLLLHYSIRGRPMGSRYIVFIEAPPDILRELTR